MKTPLIQNKAGKLFIAVAVLIMLECVKYLYGEEKEGDSFHSTVKILLKATEGVRNYMHFTLYSCLLTFGY
jgi:hypothetical protein